MWIELPDELIEATAEINTPMNPLILSIEQLFYSMYRGNNIVYGSENVLDHFQNHKLTSVTTKHIISWIKKMYIYVYEYSDEVTWKIVISSSAKKITRKEKTFTVPLIFFLDYRPVKLLTENESDANLFKNIFNQISTKKKLSTNYTIKFDNDSYHGSNASSKIKSLAENDQMMLAFVDTDCDFEGDSCKSTYTGANTSYKKFKDSKIIHLHAPNVREKENLIPPNMYLAVMNEESKLLKILKEHFLIDENIIKYFDIKDGIKYKKVRGSKWYETYKDLINKCRDEGIFDTPPKGCEKEDEYTCIKGIGANACDVVNRVILDRSVHIDTAINKNSIAKSKKEEIERCRENIFQDLPDYLMREWEDIFGLLFSWGCCLSDELIPCYEM